MFEMCIFLYILISPFIMSLSLIDLDVFGFKLSTIIQLILWGLSLISLFFIYLYKNRIKIDYIFILLTLFALFTVVKLKFDYIRFDYSFVFIACCWVLLYFLGLNIRIKQVPRGWLKYCEFAGIISILIGIILYQLNIPLYSAEYAGSDNYFKVGDIYRATGTFVNPNVFGYFIVLYAIFLLNYKQNNFILIKLLVLFYGVYVTYSRSALFFLIILIIMHTLLKINKKKAFVKKTFYSYKNVKLLYLFFILIFLSIIVIVTTIYYDFIAYDFLRLDDIFDNIRWLKWAIAITFIFTSLRTSILGNPIGTKVSLAELTFSDNQILYLLVYFGLLGALFLLVILLVCIFKSVLQLRNESLIVKRLNLIKIEILIVYFLMCTVSNASFFMPITFYIPLFVGLLNAFEREILIERGF